MDTAKASYNLTDAFAAKDVKIEALKLIKIFHMITLSALPKNPPFS